jgi:carboxyl-terminal processing protease
MLVSGPGYAAVTRLSDSAGADLRRGVDSLGRAGAQRVILDLRGVTDGGIPQAVSVARLFLDRGQVIVRVRGRRAMDSATYSADSQQAWPHLRLALLADSTTIGAAEVLCGALQDHDRATIVGTSTIGVGGTQTVFHLQAGGALALTTGAWFTPSGRPIAVRGDRFAGSNRKPPVMHTDAGRPVPGGGGIVPDISVPEFQGGQSHLKLVARDPTVRAAISALAKPIA